ncbi:MAG: 4'-phosphopantetheinyl transferase superfamily protein [Bacteroidetes bacterium]|nr:4'-phosphopantetheinyl transferase superfamily protein [Bacteroidota bacterium]
MLLCKNKFNYQITNNRRVVMPLVYQQNINAVTQIGVWHIAEEEHYFASVPLQKEITHPHKRLQHLAGRFLLKVLYPDFPLAMIRIAATRKPFLEDDAYHFSISHCRDYAAVIVSREYRTGVDIEMVNHKIKNIVPKYLSAAEQLLLPTNGIAETATLFWSVKETVYKWQGTGGTDFIRDIPIHTVAGNEQQGVVHCTFRNTIPLKVQYIFFNGNYLTWVLSDH